MEGPNFLVTMGRPSFLPEVVVAKDYEIHGAASIYELGKVVEVTFRTDKTEVINCNGAPCII